MPTDDKNIAKLKKLLSLMDEDTLTKEMFVEQWEKIVGYVKKIEEKSKLEAQQRKDELNSLAARVSGQAELTLSEITNQIQNLLVSVRDGRDGIDGRDGENPDPEIIVNEVLNRIKLPEYRAPIMDGPEEMRNKLELLAPEERPYAADTIALIKRLEELEQKASSKVFGGYTPLVRNLYNQSFPETPNGVRTTFTLVKDPKNKDGVAIYQNRTRCHLTEDFTIAGKTVTFLVAPLTGDLLIYDLTY